MRLPSPITTVALLIAFANAQATPDLCPSTTELACHDVINSSLCLSQQASRNGSPATMAKCVEYDNGMSDLPGAQKLCRCPGCHSASVNAAIVKNFPPPCA